jgi:hypothetical protein
MLQPESNREPVARPFDALRLLGSGGHWLVAPTAEIGEGVSFPPFILPRVPQSRVAWLVACGDRVWQRRQRCLAALLLLGTRCGRWTLRLPQQRCGPDAACWTASADNLSGPPSDLRLAGSYQTRVLAPGEQAIETVPALDGVHLVQVIEPARGTGPLWVFVRSAGRVRDVRPDRVVGDDLAEAIDEAMPRLRLA